MRIAYIPIFQDNYVWVIIKDSAAMVVDPGDASEVQSFLDKKQLQLKAILLTHHHQDHSAGVLRLREKYSAPVFASIQSLLSSVTAFVSEPDIIKIEPFPPFTVLNIPGHTLDHIAFYHAPYLFCGDTLFSAGCGRIMEGTAEQLFDSLQKLASLPDNTKIYCTHEYTLANLQFALTVEPNNAAMQQRLEDCRLLRTNHQPTLPSTMALERSTNPFLRCAGSEFAALRRQKDLFRAKP